MEGTWHLASKMVSQICMNTYTFVCSANLQIDAPYKWLQKFSQFFLGGLVGGTVVHYCISLSAYFPSSCCFPNSYSAFFSLHHSLFPASSMNSAFVHMHAFAHTITPPPSELSGRGGGEAKSWAFWELVFYFFKSLSGLVVCMADSLDLIPGLIQSLFQISLVHHAMPWHSSDAPVYIISGQIYARLNIKSYSLGGKKSLTLLLTIKAGNPMSKKKNCLTKLLRRLLNMNLYSFLFHSIYIFNPCFGKWNLLWCKPRFDAVMGFSFPWASPNLVF